MFKYVLFDLMRSRWSYIYLLFYLLLGFSLLFLNSNLSNAVITLMNVILILCPLIGMIFGIMYYYNSREFVALLLSQPVRRRSVFLGQYFGVSVSLALSMTLGLGIPFVFYGVFNSDAVVNFLFLLLTGVFLTFIFTALAYNIALFNENKIKGFSYGILLWLFFAVVYDGFFLLLLLTFQDYPLENFSLVATALNPIDLSRSLILLKLDISALMGYTGAVFQRFFGSSTGMLVAIGTLLLWFLFPVLRIVHRSSVKDF